MKLPCHDANWKHTRQGFFVWTDSMPAVVGRARTFAQADIQFSQALAEATNCYPPPYNYQNAPPIESEYRQYLAPWLLLWPKGDMLRSATNFAKCYAGGVCALRRAGRKPCETAGLKTG